MTGNLIVDMSADAKIAAIRGSLKDNNDPKRVRHHIAHGASMNAVDASGTDIALTVTTTDNAIVKVGNTSTLKLNGKNNHITLGPGVDAITHADGFGHVISGLSAEDSISAEALAKATLEYKADPVHGNGTLVTFIGNDAKPSGSLFVQETTPEKITANLKNITEIDAEKIAQLAAALKKGTSEPSATLTTIPFAGTNSKTIGK